MAAETAARTSTEIVASTGSRFVTLPLSVLLAAYEPTSVLDHLAATAVSPPPTLQKGPVTGSEVQADDVRPMFAVSTS